MRRVASGTPAVADGSAAAHCEGQSPFRRGQGRCALDICKCLPTWTARNPKGACSEKLLAILETKLGN